MTFDLNFDFYQAFKHVNGAKQKNFVNGFDIVNGAAVNGKYSVNKTK